MPPPYKYKSSRMRAIKILLDLVDFIRIFLVKTCLGDVRYRYIYKKLTVHSNKEKQGRRDLTMQ